LRVYRQSSLGRKGAHRNVTGQLVDTSADRSFAEVKRLANGHGMAAAAPATDLGTFLADDMGTTGGKNITAVALWSTNLQSREFAGDTRSPTMVVVEGQTTIP
jgi:hypothetical protein